MKIKCHDCGTEIETTYDPELGPFEEVQQNTVGWCPACREQNDREYDRVMREEGL